jgi:transcriptional regulator with XRE-family HTH domain
LADHTDADVPRLMPWLAGVVAERGISWRRLGKEAGVSHAALSALRSGRAARPSMETCYRLASYLHHDVAGVLQMAGYSVDAPNVELSDPELNLMFHDLLELTPEEREPVKEFVRFALARATARRASQRPKRPVRAPTSSTQ